MKVIRHDPPPSPPPTFDIVGVTYEEASILRSLLGGCYNANTNLYYKLGDVLGFSGGEGEYRLQSAAGCPIPTIHTVKKAHILDVK